MPEGVYAGRNVPGMCRALSLVVWPAMISAAAVATSGMMCVAAFLLVVWLAVVVDTKA